MYKHGDRIVVKQFNKFRPAVFISYSKDYKDIANVKFASAPYIVKVPVSSILLESVYLSPLYQLMKEVDDEI